MVVVHANVPSSALAPAIRETVRQLDPGAPPPRISTLDEVFAEQVAEPKFYTLLLDVFAALGLILAATGVYGVISYAVAHRTHEFGIRMALGAQRSRVVWMVLREVFLLAATGVAISAPIALAASRLVESFLFEMKPNDPLALTGAAVTLVIAAILAGYLPARNASRIEPTLALRHE